MDEKLALAQRKLDGQADALRRFYNECDAKLAMTMEDLSQRLA